MAEDIPHDREHGWLTEDDSTDTILRSLSSWATSVKFVSGQLERDGMAAGSPMDQSSPAFLNGVGQRIDRGVDILRARLRAHGEPPAAAQPEIDVHSLPFDTDTAKAELKAAGWIPDGYGTRWTDPDGVRWVGPAGAWRVLKRRQIEALQNDVSSPEHPRADGSYGYPKGTPTMRERAEELETDFRIKWPNVIGIDRESLVGWFHTAMCIAVEAQAVAPAAALSPTEHERVREVWERCSLWTLKDDPKRLIDWIQDVLEPFLKSAVLSPSEEPQQVTPPKYAIDRAVEVSGWSPCQSKRGAVIFSSGHVISHGHNYKPKGFECDGSAACKATCRKEAVHAEQSALLAGGSRAHASEMLHVKTVDGQLVASGSPSCVECSKLIRAAGIAWMWLYQVDGWHRYAGKEFHQLSIEASAPLSPAAQTTSESTNVSSLAELAVIGQELVPPTSSGTSDNSASERALSSLSPAPAPLKELVAEMLKLYGVKFSDMNSRDVAVETWTRQFVVSALSPQPPTLAEQEILFCLTCNVRIPDMQAFGKHQQQGHRIHSLGSPQPPSEARMSKRNCQCEVFEVCAICDPETHARLLAKIAPKP